MKVKAGDSLPQTPFSDSGFLSDSAAVVLIRHSNLQREGMLVETVKGFDNDQKTRRVSCEGNAVGATASPSVSRPRHMAMAGRLRIKLGPQNRLYKSWA